MMHLAEPNSTSTAPPYTFPEWPPQTTGSTPPGKIAAVPAGIVSGDDSGKPVIVHFGRDRSLLLTRSLVLQRTGAAVERCEDLAKIDALLDRHTHGLLVLCHSLTEAERAEVLNKVQARRWGFRSLCIARNSLEHYSQTGENETVSTLGGPHELVKKAVELLCREWASA